jgi:hypothetical protein
MQLGLRIYPDQFLNFENHGQIAHGFQENIDVFSEILRTFLRHNVRNSDILNFTRFWDRMYYFILVRKQGLNGIFNLIFVILVIDS